MSVVDELWDGEIVPALQEFIRIPNRSVVFDPDWAEHGYMGEAADLVRRWAEARPIEGLTVEVVELPGLTPVVVAEVPAFGGAAADDTVILYGHLDKQPETVGWRDGLGPWTPVIDGDRLYGRGAADDGYAAFASLAAIQAVQQAGEPHARCLLLIEGSEESGSIHLRPYVEHLAPRIGEPSFVVCLDAACPDWDRLWVTTSVRGLVNLFVTVRVLDEGVHSGAAGGIVPDTFRVLRSLLSRLEDETTGEVLLPELKVDVPADRMAQARATASAVGDALVDWPFVAGAGPVGEGPLDWMLGKTWRSCLAVTGADGLAPTANAGNVLRPVTRAKLSLRLPPTADAATAFRAVSEALTTDPPYGAEVTVEMEAAEDGWNATPTAPWLAEACDAASVAAFGAPAGYMGDGGSIPFMGMLGKRFPEAQYLNTGLLGPGTNAHGPNEFLHIPTGKRLTHVVATALAAHARRRDGG